ncbi:YybH family protein [Lysobacter tyrosinilyticus]
MSGLFASPGFALSWQTGKVEVARAGDIAYTLGSYQLTVNDANGKPIVDRGKYVTIWRKQPDGGWKSIVDTFNTDLPMEPMAPAKRRPSPSRTLPNRVVEPGQPAVTQAATAYAHPACRATR